MGAATLARRGLGTDLQAARLQAMAAVPDFAGCDEATLARIIDLGTEVRRAPGAKLQRAGSALRQALVVLEGEVTLSVDGHDRVVPSGRLLGAEALRGPGRTARVSVVARTDVVLLVFGPAELADVAELARTVAPAPARVGSRAAAFLRRRVAAPAPAVVRSPAAWA